MSKALSQAIIITIHARRFYSRCTAHVQHNQVILKLSHNMQVNSFQWQAICQGHINFTEEQIKTATINLSKGIADTSIAGQFLQRVEISET